MQKGVTDLVYCVRDFFPLQCAEIELGEDLFAFLQVHHGNLRGTVFHGFSFSDMVLMESFQLAVPKCEI